LFVKQSEYLILTTFVFKLSINKFKVIIKRLFYL